MIKFIERYVRLPRGTKTVKAGSPMVVLPWMRSTLEGIFDADVRPRQALVSIARKNAKTTFAAAVGLYALLADDEFGAEIPIMSSDERTARVCFDMARTMIMLDERLENILQLYQDKIVHPRTGSMMYVMSGYARHAQGRNPSLGIVDECHVTDVDSWDALGLGMASRARPTLLGISTQGPPDDQDNLMSRLTAYGRAGVDPAFYFQEFAAPAGCATDDREAWAMANPAMGVTVTEDHLAALQRTTRESQFRRYHLNQSVQADDAWLPAGSWAACRDPHPIPDGADICLGLDGSYNGDTTALVAVTVSPKPHVAVVGLWQPKLSAPVNVTAVEDRIREACRRWHVLELAADPYRWLRSLQVLAAEGIPVVEFPQSPSRMVGATVGVFEAAVNRQLTHDGNPDLAAHVAHARVRTDAVRGTRVAKPSKDSPLRIDLAVAMIMAHSRACYHASRPTQRRRVALF